MINQDFASNAGVTPTPIENYGPMLDSAPSPFDGAQFDTISTGEFLGVKPPMDYADVLQNQIFELNPQINEARKKRDEHDAKLLSAIQRRAKLGPAIIQKQQMEQEEAVRTGITALVLKALGVRDKFVMGGLQNYVQGRDQQFTDQAQYDQNVANQQYAMDNNQANADIQSAQYLSNQAGSDVENLIGQQGLLQKELGDVYQQDAMTAREDAKIASREKIATDNATAALARIGAQNQGRLDVEQFKANNPQVMQIYNAIFSTAGPEAANRYMNDFASTPGFKNQLTQSQVKYNEAKTGDIIAFRNPKLKIFAKQAGLIDAQTGAYLALANKRDQETMKIIAGFDELDTVDDSDIELINRAFSQNEKATAQAIADIELKITSATNILKGYDPVRDKADYDSVMKELQQWTSSLVLLKLSQKEDEERKKAEIAASKKKGSSGSGLVAPFNPGNASLKGKIGR